MISISNTTKEAFLKLTKTALEAFTGSPIKQDAKILQFVTAQFNLPNEHVIPYLFDNGDEPEAETTKLEQALDWVIDKKTKEDRRSVYLLTLLAFETNEHSSGLYLDSDRIQHKICTSQDALERGMREYFAQVFPDTDRPGRDLLNYDLVTEKIEVLCEGVPDDDGLYPDTDGSEQMALEFEISNFSTPEALEWLFTNFTIEELCDDLLGEITQDHYQIKWENQYID